MRLAGYSSIERTKPQFDQGPHDLSLTGDNPYVAFATTRFAYER